MEIKTRLSTLPQQERLRVVQKLFQRLATAFGNQWVSKWQGVNMELVYSDWADDLGEFSLGAIGYAIEETRRQVMPPNIGEFIRHCRNYAPPPDNVLKLSRKWTPEEKQRNKARLQVMAEMLAGRLKA